MRSAFLKQHTRIQSRNYLEGMAVCSRPSVKFRKRLRREQRCTRCKQRQRRYASVPSASCCWRGRGRRASSTPASSTGRDWLAAIPTSQVMPPLVQPNAAFDQQWPAGANALYELHGTRSLRSRRAWGSTHLCPSSDMSYVIERNRVMCTVQSSQHHTFVGTDFYNTLVWISCLLCNLQCNHTCVALLFFSSFKFQLSII